MAKRKTKIDTGSYKYGAIRIRDKDGKLRYSSGNGDAVQRAMLLHVAAGGTMKQIIDANKLDIDAKNTNVGLVRMSVGVALRGLIRNEQPAKIGKLTVKSLSQKVALPKVETKTPAPRKAKPAKKARKAKKAAPKAKRKPRPAPVEAPAAEAVAA